MPTQNIAGDWYTHKIRIGESIFDRLANAESFMVSVVPWADKQTSVLFLCLRPWRIFGLVESRNVLRAGVLVQSVHTMHTRQRELSELSKETVEHGIHVLRQCG
jgi:hypothetical protein